MTSPSLGRLLISHITLRGPEICQLHACIAGAPGINYEDLIACTVPAAVSEDTFGLQEGIFREALNFLLVASLVEQHGPTRRKASFYAKPMLADVPFPLLLLHHLSTREDERQQAIVLVHHQLVTQDVLVTTPAELRDEVERGPYCKLFAWTGEKLALWEHLAAYLGLIRRFERNDQLLIIPRHDLVYAALEQVLGHADEASPLADCLSRVEGTFFSCFTARGRVHGGLVHALVAMHRLGHIHLSHQSDAVHSVLLGDWRVSHVRLLAREEPHT